MIKVTLTDDQQFPVEIEINSLEKQKFTKKAVAELAEKLIDAYMELDSREKVEDTRNFCICVKGHSYYDQISDKIFCTYCAREKQ